MISQSIKEPFSLQNLPPLPNNNTHKKRQRATSIPLPATLPQPIEGLSYYDPENPLYWIAKKQKQDTSSLHIVSPSSTSRTPEAVLSNQINDSPLLEYLQPQNKNKSNKNNNNNQMSSQTKAILRLYDLKKKRKTK